MSIAVLFLPAAAGCTSGRAAKRDPPASTSNTSDLGVDPGKTVSVPTSPPERAALDAFEAERAATRSMTSADFERRYALPFRDRLPYAPLGAAGLAQIEANGTTLDAGDRERLARDGFLLLPGVNYPTFAFAYAGAFRKHLPVYVSADAILFAVHKSFDALLKAIEINLLMHELGTVIGRMRDRLKEGRLGGASPEVTADVDAYLAVAATLLEGEPVWPLAAGRADSVGTLVAAATAAAGEGHVTLFGENRDLDFSQFKPRGHYQGDPALERYFRTMIWLSRTDLRAIEVNPDGTQSFRRRQLEAAFVLRDLLDDDARAAWTRLDRTLEAFVGERDEMNVRDLDALGSELGIKSASELTRVSDDTILATLARTGLGRQRIASQLMVRSPAAKGPLPLHTSFAFINQRYTLDAHVLSNVSYDRLRSGATRMMPDPLDVGFAALGNDGAAELLRDQLDRFEYAPELHMMRVLASAHGDDYWEKSLYGTWSSALRALSPTAAALEAPSEGGLPAVAATRAWNDRILSTQLASWAELRHDTVLYAKQSYTMGAMCEFPDAYVDPYPEFFHRIATHARFGERLTAEVLSADPRVEQMAQAYFARLAEVAGALEEIATRERTGKGLTKSQLDFVNGMVSLRPAGGCGGPPTLTGWYGDLFVDRDDLSQFAPTIADVHTQPTDENGAVVGRVLHVGTGAVSGLLVTVDSCDGAHAYLGYASSYYEKTTSNFERLDDQRWAQELRATPRPRAPAWLEGILPPRRSP